MKKIAALALSLALIPSAAFADQIFNIPFGQSFQSGIYLPTVTSGQCLTTTGAMSKVVGLTCGTGIVQSVTAGTGVTITGTTANPIVNASGGTPFTVAFLPNNFGLSSTSTYLVNSTNGYRSVLPVGFSIGHAAITCATYNAADATAGNGPYNPLDASGLGGGTVSLAITNTSFPMTAPNVIGTIVLPTSPQAGPYVSSVSVATTAYTLGANDNLLFAVTSVSASTNPLSMCAITAGP